AYARPCDCRKPGRGLVDRAAAEFGIDPAQSFVVGDRWLDVELARVISGRGVLVRTGYGLAEETRPRPDLAADAIVDDLIGAAGSGPTCRGGDSCLACVAASSGAASSGPDTIGRR